MLRACSMFYMYIIPIFRPFRTVFYNMVQDMPYLFSFFLNHSSVTGCLCCFWFLTLRTGAKTTVWSSGCRKKIFFHGCYL